MKFKKCCLIKEPRVGTDSFTTNGPAIPSAIVEKVLNAISALTEDELLLQRLDALADSQPHLCAFITPLSSSLPATVSFQAALSAFAIIWMFEEYQQQPLPKIGVAAIQRVLDRNAKSFFDLDDVHNSTMAGKHQPFLHQFIADTILDFDEGHLDAFSLFTLFMMLKTTVDVLHNATSKITADGPQLLQPVAAL